jgi:hypothetical protein
MSDVETNQGCVYLMRNKSMPKLVKIGFTTGDAHERANALSTPTGVPTPFEVVGLVETPWPREVESEAHQQLDFLRVTRVREFFEADASRDNSMATNEEMNQYFILIVTHAAEVVELHKRQEAIDTERQDMRARHARQQSAFLHDCMKKNYPERYEKVLERFRRAEEFQAGSEPEPDSLNECDISRYA